MNVKKNRPTIMDVAGHSGVSYQTVSRVINNHPYVSEDARQRVLDAIELLGYQPNKAAAKLASKTANSIAVVTYGNGYYGPTQMALSIERAAKAHGFDAIFTNVGAIGKELTEALQHISGWQVDGVILIIPVEGMSFEDIKRTCPTIPVVQIDTKRVSNIPAIMIDDEGGVNQIVDHLLELGHREIATICGPQLWFSAQERLQALYKNLSKLNLSPADVVEGDWSPASGYHAMQSLLHRKARFSAVVVANDQMALGALRALHEANVRTPDDVAVVGFDNIPEAAFFQPPLTTVHQDFSALGIAGFDYLLQWIENPDLSPRQHLIHPKLIIRQSTRQNQIELT